MDKKPVLVVMAAGMGSRYGGLKQIDPVGSQGEAILDYSIYDAHRAGFDTVVLVIKEAIRQEFMDTVGKRLAKAPVEVRYAFQELDMLPEGFRAPDQRTKPWGTGHAVLCAAQAVDGAPFAVINADDYYGPRAFREIYQRLSQCRTPGSYCMVGYELGKTVTEHGSVSRGVCAMDEGGRLTGITERTRIQTFPEAIRFTEDGENWTDIPAGTIVSMNMWGFQPDFLDRSQALFADFLTAALAENPLKAEFYLPQAVSSLIQTGAATVQVLTSPDRWYGVTYAQDKPTVTAALKTMTTQGLYPNGLWN